MSLAPKLSPARDQAKGNTKWLKATHDLRHMQKTTLCENSAWSGALAESGKACRRRSRAAIKASFAFFPS